MNEEALLIVGATAAIILLLLALGALIVHSRRKRKRDELKGRYGPEYDHAVAEHGKKAAVEDLDTRAQAREGFTPATLTETETEALRKRLATLQYRFVDDPSDVLLETQRIVVDTLRAQGYPIATDRERALKLLSVDHPNATATLRTLLSGSYGDDSGRMHTLFAGTKTALRDIAGLSFSSDDLPAHTSAETHQPQQAPATADAPEPRQPQQTRPAANADGTEPQPAAANTAAPPVPTR